MRDMERETRTTPALDRISWRVGDAGHTVFGPKIDGAVSPETIASVRKASNARFIVAAQAFVYRMAEQGNADALALVLGDEYNDSAPHKDTGRRADGPTSKRA